MDELKNEIYEKIRIARANRYLTNCYSMDVVDHSQKIYTDRDGFIFSYEDHGIIRLAFFVKKLDALDNIIKKMDNGKFFLEFMTKNPEQYTPANSVLRAKMMRLANVDCNSVFKADSKVIQFMGRASAHMAKESDAEEINKILWTTFHTEVSHLLSNDEVADKIREAQFTIHKNNHGQIDALLQADVMPKKFYINQVVNKTKKHVIHAILMQRLEEYVNHGGKYLYAWVEDNNVASLKFHEKYDMKHDGMYSMIYCIER